MAKKIEGVELPSTIERSPSRAQRTYAKTKARAEKQYGDGERAGRTAYAALKNSFEKVGDHWEPKAHPGPSDPRSKQPADRKRAGKGETFGGVDVEQHTRKELYERARSMGLPVRTRMKKDEIARVLARQRT
jgi:hypothetical protein